MCNSCASLAGLVLCFTACFILLVIAPLPMRVDNRRRSREPARARRLMALPAVCKASYNPFIEHKRIYSRLDVSITSSDRSMAMLRLSTAIIPTSGRSKTKTACVRRVGLRGVLGGRPCATAVHARPPCVLFLSRSHGSGKALPSNGTAATFLRHFDVKWNHSSCLYDPMAVL